MGLSNPYRGRPAPHDVLLELQDQSRRQELHRCQRDLWYLATEKLDLTFLSPTFHKPMLARWDDQRRRRAQGEMFDAADFWARAHCKTFCRMAQAIQDLLCDPLTSITWFHAVEEMAQDASLWISRQLFDNQHLRDLLPDGILPSKQDKKFVSPFGFNLPGNSRGRFRSFSPFGWKSTATGHHSLVVYLDDPMDQKILSDSQLPRWRNWIQHTVQQVVFPFGWKNWTGTRWAVEDGYSDMMSGAWPRFTGTKGYEVTVRAILERDGIPDYTGRPVFFTAEQVREKRRKEGSMFGPQCMNDPTPAEESPWLAETHENYISLRDLQGNPGITVLISDASPAINEEVNDPRKDEWANAVLRIDVVNAIQRVVLIQGTASQSWTPRKGFEEMARLAMLYRVSHWSIECSGQATSYYIPDIEELFGMRGIGAEYVKLKAGQYGKNPRFRMMADRAKLREFLICKETVDPEFLDLLLSQCRLWRILDARGANGLKHDDRADVCAMAFDPAWQEYAPLPTGFSFDAGTFSRPEFRHMEPERCRYLDL